MSYDLVVFDDDIDIHCPKHFMFKTHKGTKFIGYSKRSEPFERCILHRYSNNFILRRLYKLFTVLSYMRKNLTQQHILIYDDALSFIILKLLKNNEVVLRITHPKDKDTMPQIYTTSVYKLVSRYANTHNIYVISPLLKRYLKRYFDIDAMVWPSMVELETKDVDIYKKKNNVIYSGTLTNRGSISNFLHIVKQLQEYYAIDSLTILSPKIELADRELVLSWCTRHHLSVELHENFSQEKIKDIYKTARFGIAFYDVLHNHILKQNFPLKTLEYIAFGIIPVGNPINSHRWLSNRKIQFLFTGYSDATIINFIRQDDLVDIAKNNRIWLGKYSDLVIRKNKLDDKTKF